MQIIEQGEFHALCEGMGQQKQIDMALVGPQPVGTWLLTFLNAAREVIEPSEAEKITEALTALNQVMQGRDDNVGTLFADLTGREPQLPDHLK